ncbi:hypothetical protein MKEN_00592600 [Mycena kentingensis (nom. inval.)]|nr:hypothetical protein MKEN_00592600 [Mycena kentingensis (nom. inval.)]
MIPWSAQAVHHRASLREGLKIVRGVLNRNSKNEGLTTRELFRLAVQEPVSEEFTAGLGTSRPWRESGVPRPAGAQVPPGPPHAHHPVRSLSFLKHHILPVIEREKTVKHGRETRTTTHTTGHANSKRGIQVSTSRKVVWAWRTQRRPVSRKPTAQRPDYVYDYSHMKPAKQRAHRGYHAFIAKRNMLRARTAAKEAEARKIAEKPMREEAKAAARARHMEQERLGAIAREERRKRWAKQNPQLADQLAAKKRREEKAKADAARKPVPGKKRQTA